MTHWYHQLNAIPASRDSFAYLRLKRIWNDKTRYHGPPNSPKRIHEFFDKKHETSLTVALWENFAILDPDIWLNELFKFSGINLSIEKILKCNWSYEWEKRSKDAKRLCDIVIKFADSNDIEYLLVVECKYLGKAISDKDTRPEYYLEIEDFEPFKENRLLIYCVSKNVKQKVSQQILQSKFKTGIVTWEELAAIQFNSINKHNFNDSLKGFLCGTILNQFLSKSIEPESLPFTYLSDEHPQEKVDLEIKDKQSSLDRERKYWDE